MCVCVCVSECRLLVGCMVPTVVKIRKKKEGTKKKSHIVPPPLFLPLPSLVLTVGYAFPRVVFYFICRFLAPYNIKKKKRKRTHKQPLQFFFFFFFLNRTYQSCCPLHIASHPFYTSVSHYNNTHSRAETADLLLYSDRSSAAVKSFCMTYDFPCCSPPPLHHATLFFYRKC